MSKATDVTLVIPPDMRAAQCTCKSGLNTATDVQKAFKEVQQEYTRRWKFVEKTAKLLAKYGFKPGVDVMGDYDIEHQGEYPLDWTVNEAVYLATGYGKVGDLSGGIQEGDWTAHTKPNTKAAIAYIASSNRLQPVKLTKTQTTTLKKSFEETYHAHLHLVAPMSRVYTFIHENVGHICDLPDKVQEEIYDFLWEFRHADPNDAHKDVNGKPMPKQYWFDAEQLLELIVKVQTEKKAA